VDVQQFYSTRLKADEHALKRLMDAPAAPRWLTNSETFSQKEPEGRGVGRNLR